MSVSTSFWEKKIRTVFQSLDTDKDGILRRRDFELWEDRLIKALPSAIEEQKQQIRQSRIDIWVNFVNGGESPTEGAEVTVDQFIKSFRVKLKDPGLRDQLESVTRAIFDVLDINKDGVLKKDEYVKLATLKPNTTTAVAEAAFNAMDKSNDGAIQFEEFLGATVFFFTDENDTSSPLNDMFGKLE